MNPGDLILLFASIAAIGWSLYRLFSDHYKLKRVTRFLDGLRPIRFDQEGRIVSALKLTTNKEVRRILKEFLSEMQKAKDIHAQIDKEIGR